MGLVSFWVRMLPTRMAVRARLGIKKKSKASLSGEFAGVCGTDVKSFQAERSKKGGKQKTKEEGGATRGGHRVRGGKPVKWKIGSCSLKASLE